MVDQNTFINTYIDIIINTLLDQTKANLQLQTQVKCNEFVVANKEQQLQEVIKEKDTVIESLQAQLRENTVADDWRRKYEAAETNYAASLQKLGHMDTLLNQVAEMKKQIMERDAEIARLKTVSANNEVKKVELNNVTKLKRKETTLDDF